MRAIIDGEKTCTKCGETKPLTDFSKHSQCIGGYNTRCKKCIAANSKKWTEANSEKKRANDLARSRVMKQRAVDYFGNKCADCGGSFPNCVFQFHHLNPSEKDVNPSYAFKRTWERLKVELDKCVMLCANCHMIRHHSQGGSQS